MTAQPCGEFGKPGNEISPCSFHSFFPFSFDGGKCNINIELSSFIDFFYLFIYFAYHFFSFNWKVKYPQHVHWAK